MQNRKQGAQQVRQILNLGACLADVPSVRAGQVKVVTPLAITKFIMIARRELDSHDSGDCALKTLASPN